MADAFRPIYRVGEIEVDTIRGCVRRGSEELHLRPRTMQVLLHLLEHRHRLVTRDELLIQFWKDTAVTDDALAQCIADVRRAFGDSSREPKVLKTVPKVGYRWIATVEEIAGASATTPITPRKEELFPTEPAIDEPIEGANAMRSRRGLPLARLPGRSSWTTAALIALAAGTILAAVAIGRPEPAPGPPVSLGELPGKTAVAVMYLENQSKSQELDWLREGLADMLIANLSGANQLAVLSRPELHLVLEHIGHAPDRPIDLPVALDVARRTRASVVALGSFATFGKTVRVSVHLHDASTGRLRVSENISVDEPERIPARVEELSAKIAAHLGAVMPAAEGNARESGIMTANLEAYRYYSLGVERANTADNQAAIQLFERAIALDPAFAMAHARIGYAYAVTGSYAERGRPYLERAFRLAGRLTEKDRLFITAWYAIANLDYTGAMIPLRQIIASYPAEIEAYLRLGLLLAGEERSGEAIDIFERGLKFDPDAKDLLRELGVLHGQRGSYVRATELLEKVVSLAPQEPLGHVRLGHTYRVAGRYDEAAAAFARALTLNSAFQPAILGLGVLYVDVGRYRDALQQFRRYAASAALELERGGGYRHIGLVYLRLGDLAKAEQAANEEMKHDKTSVWNALDVALQRGEEEKVKQLTKLFDTEYPYTGRGIRPLQRYKTAHRGVIALRSGRRAEALALFRETLRYRAPIFNLETFEDYLANAYLQLAQLDDAIAEYQRVLRLNPNAAVSRYHLGTAYEQKGMAREAEAEFRQFLQIWRDADTDIPELRNAKARLNHLRLP